MHKKTNTSDSRHFSVIALVIAWTPLVYCGYWGSAKGAAAVNETIMGTLGGQAVLLIAALISMLCLMTAARKALAASQALLHRTSSLRRVRLPEWVAGKDDSFIEESSVVEKATTFGLGIFITFVAGITTAMGAFLVAHSAFVPGVFMITIASHAAVLSKATGIAGVLNLLLGKVAHKAAKQAGRLVASIVLSIIMPGRR